MTCKFNYPSSQGTQSVVRVRDTWMIGWIWWWKWKQGVSTEAVWASQRRSHCIWTWRVGRMWGGTTAGGLRGKGKTWWVEGAGRADAGRGERNGEQAGQDHGFPPPFSRSVMCWLLPSAQHWAELNFRMKMVTLTDCVPPSQMKETGTNLDFVMSGVKHMNII